MSTPSISSYLYRIFHLIVVARSAKITVGTLLLLLSFRVGAFCSENTEPQPLLEGDAFIAGLDNLSDEGFVQLFRTFEQFLETTAILQSRSTNIIGLNPLIVAETDTGGSAGVADHPSKTPISFFTSYLNGSGDNESSATGANYEWDVDAIAIGADYRFSSEIALGLMYGRSDFSGCRAGVLNSSPLANVQLLDFKLNGEYNILSSYGIWETDTVFFDTILSFGTGNFDYRRTQISLFFEGEQPFEERIIADYGSSFIRGSIAGGRKFQINNLGIDVYGRFSYSNITLEGYNERVQPDAAFELGLVNPIDVYSVQKSDINSAISGVGSRVNLVYGSASAIITTYLNFEWIHDFESSRETKVDFVDSASPDDPFILVSDIDQDYWSVGLGASALFKNGITLFGGVNTLIDFDLTDELLVGLGGRFEF